MLLMMVLMMAIMMSMNAEEAIILRINAMIVINRKRGARLASVCVCGGLFLAYAYIFYNAIA